MHAKKITGTYDDDDLSQLLWPIAWSGTTHQSDREEEEAALRLLVKEAREAICCDPDAVAVEIADGEIVCTISATCDCDVTCDCEY